MTTAADNLRKWLARVPAVGEVIELHPLGALPTDSPLASWPRDEVARDAELVRAAISDTAQEHCDDEGQATTYALEWKRGEKIISTRRVRFHPSVGSEPVRNGGDTINSAELVRDLLKTITDQQRLMIQSVGAIVAAHQSSLSAVTEQMRALHERVLAQDAPRDESTDAEREMRVRALGVVLDRGPAILDLLLAAGANKVLGGDGSGDAGGTTQ